MEFYHNDLINHAAFHGVKMRPYISSDEKIEKANRLDEIIDQEVDRNLEATLAEMQDKIKQIEQKRNDHSR